MRAILLLVLLLITNSSLALVLNLDNTKTPGSFCTVQDPNFKEYRYKEQIPVCNRNVMSSLKKKVYASYNVPENEMALYTIDHKIPLSMGGSNSQDNLWPQPRVTTSAVLELLVFNLIKEDRISQKEALDLVLSVKK